MIRPTRAGLAKKVVQSPQPQMTRARNGRVPPIPKTIYGGALPSGIRSSWVFVLCAGASTGAERHPNSHQRMMSFEAAGDLQVRAGLADGGEGEWQSNYLVSDPDAPLERRWIS